MSPQPIKYNNEANMSGRFPPADTITGRLAIFALAARRCRLTAAAVLDLMLVRRLLYFVPVTLTVLYGCSMMLDIISANGIQIVEYVMLGLFAATFTLIALAFWACLIGFLIRLIAKDPVAFVSPIARCKASAASGQTALVMPIYNEDAARVANGIGATLNSLLATGQAANFHFFLLSDTTDAAIAAEEHAAFRRLHRRYRGRIRMTYRRRPLNQGRKAGNIADFGRRWGHRFDHMVVLDADSVMTGRVLVDLVRIMTVNPDAGIVQTLPMAVGQTTLFGRIHQFATHMASETFATGFAFWQMGDGNYFGHNAIIRLKPFVEHCHMPVLSGQAPMGGEILSHDFVEAALMRRAGFGVWVLPDGTGSYEEIPTNLLDHAKRDRRWCQGNLQHLRLLAMPGLTLMSRYHLLMGVAAYTSSVLWLLLIGAGLIAQLQITFSPIDYFQGGPALFPAWPVAKTREFLSLLGLTLFVLLAPRALALCLSLIDRRWQRIGLGSVVASTLLEIIFSTLLAPVLMLFNTLSVTATLAGRSIHWTAQPRHGRGLGLTECVDRLYGHTLLGLIVLAGVAPLVPHAVAWLSPVLTGLVFAIPVCLISSRVGAGQLCQRLGLFLTPSEVAPERVVRQLGAAPAANDGATFGSLPPTTVPALIARRDVPVPGQG